MPLFNAKFHTFDFEMGTVSRTMDEAIKRQIRQAARVFANVMARLVPYRTGFARGTVRNIYEAVGSSGGAGERELPADSSLRILRAIKASSNFHVNPTTHPTLAGMFRVSAGSLSRAAGNQLGMPIEYYREGKRKILKTPQSGRQFATPPGQIFGSDGNGFYTFNFSVAISYFNINDFNANPHTPSSPWQSFQAAQASAFNYLQTEGMKKLPRVSDFMVEYEVNVTGSNVSKRRLGVLNRTTQFRT